MNRRMCVCIAVLLAGLSCGGTATKIAYANLDRIILYEIRDWFSIHEEQEKALIPRLDEFLRRHRSEKLPRYRPLLERAQKTVLAGVGEKEYGALTAMVGAEVVRIADMAAPDAARLALTLDNSQLERFSRKCEESNLKIEKLIKEKQTDPEKIRVERMMKTLGHLYGSFDSAQERKIAAIVMTYDDAENLELYLRYLRETQNGFVRLLRAKKGHDAVSAYLHGWICRDPGFLPLYYRAELERSAALKARIVAEVDRSVVRPEQRRAGAAALQGYIDAIDELIRR